MDKFQQALKNLIDTVRSFRSAIGDDNRYKSYLADLENKASDLEKSYGIDEVRVKNEKSKTRFNRFDFILSFAPTAIAVLLTVAVFMFITLYKNRTADNLEQQATIQKMSAYYELSAKTLLNNTPFYKDSLSYQRALDYVRSADSLQKQLDPGRYNIQPVFPDSNRFKR